MLSPSSTQLQHTHNWYAAFVVKRILQLFDGTLFSIVLVSS